MHLIKFFLSCFLIIPLPSSGSFFGIDSLAIEHSRSEVIIVDTSVEYTFGGLITFQAQIQSDTPIDEISLFIQPETDKDVLVETTNVKPSGRVVHTLDPTQHTIRAFSTVFYWYYVTLSNSESYTSSTFSFVYEDNRYEWQTLDSDTFRVYWYEGDVALAQAVLNIAEDGLKQIQSLISAPQPKKLTIRLYASVRELQKTLQSAGQSWIAGHADPDLGIIFAHQPPGPNQIHEIKRQVPHELSHIILYQMTGSAYKYLPQWLNEGVASISELYPNPDYHVILQNAYQQGTLIPISDLCASFPVDTPSILIAYSESASFIEFLFEQYGSSGLETLIYHYNDGMGCEQGVKAAYGATITQLEREWRRVVFNENIVQVNLKALLPWLLVLIVVTIGPIALAIRSISRKKSQ